MAICKKGICKHAHTKTTAIIDYHTLTATVYEICTDCEKELNSMVLSCDTCRQIYWNTPRDDGLFKIERKNHEQEIKFHKDLIDKLRSEVELLEDQSMQTNEENHLLHCELDGCKEEIAELNTENENLHADIHELREALDDQREAFELEKAGYRLQINSRYGKFPSPPSDEIEHLKKVNRGLATELRRLKLDVEHFRQGQLRDNPGTKKLEDENEYLKAQLRGMKATREIANNEEQVRLQEINAKLATELQNLREQNENQQKAIDVMAKLIWDKV